jgi:hypothetical protein
MKKNTLVLVLKQYKNMIKTMSLSTQFIKIIKDYMKTFPEEVQQKMTKCEQENMYGTSNFQKVEIALKL